VSRRELFDKMPDQRQVCGKMAMLSAHDRRIMYIPMGNLYPTDLNRNTFFRKIANNVEDEDGSSGGYSEECRLDSLYQYAVLIGKTPLDKEFNSIYTAIYWSRQRPCLVADYTNSSRHQSRMPLC
jgi:hypothetical protein